jgi:hypothetical protein
MSGATKSPLLESSALRDGGAVAGLALATLGFFWRVVVGQNWMPADGGDLVSFLYPTYRWAAQTLAEGTWPLWNGGLYAGAPHVGDVQAGFLYPPNLALFLLWPNFPYSVLQWMSIGHIWFAGAGMYLFLARGLRTGRVPALAGSLAFMFSDPFIVHFGNLNYNAVASWLPWVFWAFSVCLSRLRRDDISPVSAIRWAARAGLLLAIGSLAGHIQATLFILLSLAIYTLGWLWLYREEAAPAPRAAYALAALSVATGFLVLAAAPILLPSLELSRFAQRTVWQYTQTAGYSLAPVQLIGWLVPGFFGRGPQFHWGSWPRVEMGYLGILPLLLAVAALLVRRDRAVWNWLILAGVSLLLALGIYGIPHGWLTLLPGFDQLRAPARLVLITDFAVAVLAALGLQALLGLVRAPLAEGVSTLWRLVKAATGGTVLVAAPLAFLSLLLTQDRDAVVVMRVAIAAIAVVTFAGLLAISACWLKALISGWGGRSTLGWLAIGIIFIDVASLGAYQDLGDKDPSRSFEQPAIVGFLASQPGPFRIDARTGIDGLWQPDTALLHGLEDVGGLANPLLLSDTARYWDGLGSRSSALYDLLNVRYLIAPKDVALDWDKFELAFDGDPLLNVYLNRSALPRAFLVFDAQFVGEHEAAWDAVHRPEFDPRRQVVVESPADALAHTNAGAVGGVEIVRSAPGRLELSSSADGPAWLVVSQSWYPGWRVILDGADVGSPLRADYAFQAAPLPAGDHTIVLEYRPVLWRLGWWLAGASIVLAGVTTLLWKRRNRRRLATKQVGS